MLMLLACLALVPRKYFAMPHFPIITIRPEDYQVVAFVCLVIICEICERWRPARNIDRWADMKIDLLSFTLAIIINRFCTHAVRSIINTAVPAAFAGGWHTLQSLPGPVKIALSIVVADFIIYWLHRAQHHFDLLWRTHAWHHSSEHLYWFSGFRTSFLHSFMNNIPQAAVPMLIFGLTPFQAGIGYAIGVLIQFWEHTNVRVNIGPLKWIFITPDYHRVHHSATEHCRKNLGGTFSIWDRMFGTYVDPDTMPEAFPIGLGEPVDKKKIPRMLLGV
jgi:sterol desaturase/sphingolipid hydroxylase (fatty acid hydroxylase superfamily)